MNMHLTGMDGGPVEIEPEAYQTFKTGFRGVLLTPQDATFDETRKLWNGMIDRRPGLIARCTGTVDVVQAVRFAAQHRLLLSVRSGGHNIAGLATNDGGIMIDMSRLRGIWVDPAGCTACAQAGCTLADMDRETQLHGLAAVLGFVSTTGIAGLTLGGGFGYLTRRHGWTCDTLVSMEVVMADGQVVRASADEHAELFWALRGGGGNFGVVTAFEYRLFPVGPEIVGGAIAWHGADARQVLQAYRDVSARAPREMTSVAVLRVAPPAPWLPPEIHGQPMAAIFVCHTGDMAEADALLAPLREVARPVADTVMRRPYVQMQSLLDATQPKGRRYYWKSHYLAHIEPSLMDLAMEHAGRIASPFSALLMFQIQGALGEQSAGHSPAGNRDAAYVLNIAASWEKPEEDDLQLRWARDCFEATRGCSTGGTYINFLTEEEGAERIQAAYGRTNLDRLAALKTRYDPHNLFRGTKGLTG
ncbi:FAD-binding oxidoreductase [Hydrogenophaga aromaticivorans]|uniref:FAD-binding oxidoreductase n=1 Tax=Hydrogenophaga aromaticivorans TaxID=2610898 RepID=UPI001B364A5C|nr:FAD-binding oxidoreductase [Hydrogenophaga aromaticivorans]MBQ0920937.1 FAD-binding oxidoreductase [Hydrogenophaga aromaticivorans]